MFKRIMHDDDPEVAHRGGTYCNHPWFTANVRYVPEESGLYGLFTQDRIPQGVKNGITWLKRHQSTKDHDL